MWRTSSWLIEHQHLLSYRQFPAHCNNNLFGDQITVSVSCDQKNVIVTPGCRHSRRFGRRIYCERAQNSFVQGVQGSKSKRAKAKRHNKPETSETSRGRRCSILLKEVSTGRVQEQNQGQNQISGRPVPHLSLSQLNPHQNQSPVLVPYLTHITVTRRGRD